MLQLYHLAFLAALVGRPPLASFTPASAVPVPLSRTCPVMRKPVAPPVGDDVYLRRDAIDAKHG